MQNRSKTGLILLVATLVFVGFVIVPGVQAQGSTIGARGNPTVTPPQIRPGSETAVVKIPFSYQPGSSAQYAIGTVASSVTITATKGTCSNYIQIIGATAANFALPAPGPTVTPINEELSFQVSLKPDAPGLENLNCDFSVGASEVNEQTLTAPDPFPTSIAVRGNYIALIQANVANGKLKTTGPQKEVPYQLELTNFGNAKTIVTFAITDEPKGSKWQALAPEQVTLNTEQSGLGNKQTIPFIVSTTYKNGWNNAVGGYTLELQPIAFSDAEERGTPTQVNVLARVRGVYVPGVEPFVLVAAVLGAALVARLTRDDDE